MSKSIINKRRRIYLTAEAIIKNGLSVRKQKKRFLVLVFE